MMKSPLDGVSLHFVESLSDVLAMYEWAGERRDGPIGYDTEATGLNPVTDRIRLAQLGDKNHGWAVPVEWIGAVIELLKKIIARRDYLVAHNSIYDARITRYSTGYQIPWHALHDTMLLARLADPLRPKGLKPLANRLIDPRASGGQRLLDDGMRRNGWTWATVPASFPPYHAYAALDPVLTRHLYDMFYPRISEECPAAYDLERAILPVVGTMMDHGLLVDQAYVHTQIKRLRDYAGRVREWLAGVYSIDSLMSARQIGTALTELGISDLPTTPKTGQYSITKEILEAIYSNPDNSQQARELARTVHRARHAEKMIGTYLENFLERAAYDGCVHPSINQMAARTSRMSCSEPNLQNLPRDDKVVRGAFVPHEGYVLISVDAQQIEMRIFSSLSEDAGLIEAFKHADSTGIDFYAVLASEIFQDQVSKKDPRRQSTKSASYARIFGAGLKKMAITAGVTTEQMRPVNDALGQRYPGMNSWPGSLIADMRNMMRGGEQPGTRTGTGRFLPVDSDTLYACVNYRVQAEAAECLKRAGVALASAGFQDMMRLFVHDEVILEVPASEAESVLMAVTEVLTNANPHYSVPITWDGNIMRERWVKT